MRRIHRFAAWAAVSLLAAAASAEEKQAESPALEVIKLASPANAFAFDSASGTLVAVDSRGGTVAAYSRDFLNGKSAKPVGPVKVGRKPVAVVYKRFKDKRYVIVGSLDESGLRVLEADTLKAVKRVALPGKSVYHLATSASDTDPYVYYSVGIDSYDPSYPRDGTVGRMDVEKLADADQFQLVADEVVLSPDGRRLYARRAFSSPSGFAVYEVVSGETGPTALRRLHEEHEDAPSYVPDPYNEYVAVGRALYTPDLRRKITELPFWPNAFFSDRPLIVGLADSAGTQRFGVSPDSPPIALVVASYNTQQEVGRLALPGDFFAAALQSQRDDRFEDLMHTAFRVHVFADSAGERVLVALVDKVLPIRLADLNLPAEPFLHVVVKSPRHFFLGEQSTVRMTALDEKSRVELLDAPQGMKLANNALTWTPGAQDTGSQTITLKVSKGDLAREQVLHFDVTARYMKLRFEAEGFFVSPDARWGVAWANGQGQDDSDTCRVALLDLAQRRVVSRKLAHRISAAAADEHYVYVAVQEKNTFLALDHKALATQRRIFTEGFPSQFNLDVPGRLGVLQHGGLLELSTPELKPLPDAPKPRLVEHWVNSEGHVPRRLPEGIYYRGCVFDRELKQVRLLFNLPDCLQLHPRPLEHFHPDESPVLEPWDRSAAHGGFGVGITDSQGRPIIRTNGGVDLSPDFPLAVLLGRAHEADDVRLVLAFHEIVTGAELESLTLATSPRGSFFAESTDSNLPVFVRGKQVFACVGDRVFVYTLTDQQLKQFPVPFCFERVQEKLVLDSKGEATLTHKVRGAEGQVEFELDESLAGLQLQGMKLDSQSGALTIDGPALTKSIISIFAQSVSRRMVPGFEDVDAVTEATHERFRQLVGRPSKGMPILVPVRLVARDESQQIARLNYLVFLELPEDEARAALAAGPEAASPAPVPAIPVPIPGAPRPPAGTLEQRLTAMEQRLAQLEAKLDSVLAALKPEPAEEPADSQDEE